MVKAGLYLRLSREDEGEEDSQSILNQKEFLINHCIKNSYKIIDIYIDDGYSGTTFDRPGFNHLLQAIENKDINTVLTKDLSRLGRDYIITGYFTEHFFPSHSIRYIAVNDNIDTARDTAGNDLTPFRAVFNDLYAKDISKKVRSVLKSKAQLGKFIGTYAPFGYQKDIKVKNHLIIDEQKARIVKKIYTMFLEGMTISEIACKLTNEGIPTPSFKEYNTQSKPLSWSYTMVHRILTSQTYVGTTVSHMHQKINYKVQKVIKLPPEEWCVVLNTHEPIISLDEFQIVQQLLQKRKYVTAPHSEAERLLKNHIFCGDCNCSMIPWSNQKARYFVCSTWKRNGKNVCSPHRIRQDNIEKTVLTLFHLYQILYYCQDAEPGNIDYREIQFQFYIKNEYRLFLLLPFGDIYL